jgi:3-oxoadipate enol-lactonase
MFKVIRRQFLATPVQGFIGCGEAIRKLNYLDRLSFINKPTLIIVGDDDPAAPVAGVKGIQERIKGSKLAVLPSARHISNVEQADAFNKALTKFLQGM